MKTHLVGENERKFDFVRYLGIPTTTQDERTRATSRNGGDETEGRHSSRRLVMVTREVPMGLRKQHSKMRPRKHPESQTKEGNANPILSYAIVILRTSSASLAGPHITIMFCLSDCHYVFSHWKSVFATSPSFNLCHAWLCATHAYHLTG